MDERYRDAPSASGIAHSAFFFDFVFFARSFLGVAPVNNIHQFGFNLPEPPKFRPIGIGASGYLSHLKLCPSSLPEKSGNLVSHAHRPLTGVSTSHLCISYAGWSCTPISPLWTDYNKAMHTAGRRTKSSRATTECMARALADRHACCRLEFPEFMLPLLHRAAAFSLYLSLLICLQFGACGGSALPTQPGTSR
ncbi:hypothetical protein K461DRAFT_88837 [Myriangium duriaei CBS 260.36]|uniref:Uncharacterized protein n=1 Tax=Myriangium duriaei CBS 260.36 TaxID=1168546 RepID=A0A9P4JBR4_9PEZI|nr:hypothetical protein K461DRAFT_88837 [Myriangium duriaei CBS 260.36]